MKTIKNILFTILLMGIVLVVYLSRNNISVSIKDFLVKENKPIIAESNEYKRNFDYIRFSYIDDYTPYNKEDILNIYFNILNNGWKEFTFYCPSEYVNCMDDVNDLVTDEILMTKINNYVHPYNSFSDLNTKIISNGAITVKVTYKYPQDKIITINNKVNEIVKSLDLNGKTDREKISLIHNYIISHSTYDDNAISNNSPYDSTSAYGNLIEGYSVCSGYSDAMAIFLDLLNIPNIKISSENHIWNLVYIEGQWLHLDLTWDDAEDQRFQNNYFLITKEKLHKLDREEHLYDEEFFLEAF